MRIRHKTRFLQCRCTALQQLSLKDYIYVYIYIYIYIYYKSVIKSLRGYVSKQVQYNMESAQYLGQS